ncbi:acyl-CoA dehydrogenase [Herbaspirillum lusitanum]|uniref:Acyl-CoA dehydrogenase n=1 Tax=Herbaspirillum lusitanum TaxID=213312 RepID=A0ABW9ABN7_9BURK
MHKPARKIIPAQDIAQTIAALNAMVGLPLAHATQAGMPALVGELLCQLVDNGMGDLPLPGHGRTLQRWRMLAAVAAQDLSLAKLFEAHTDALAILAEAGVHDLPPHAVWGVWCAESKDGALQVRDIVAGHSLMLNGEKLWCSGAASVTHALIGYRDQRQRSCLAAVDLAQEGVEIVGDDWKAVGMAATATSVLQLKNVRGTPVGPAGFYLSRAGFWQGGAGIAACWHGAAAALAGCTRDWLKSRNDAHALAHLGQLEVVLHASAAALRELAAWIDANPASDAMRGALRVRLQAEHAAQHALTHSGRALGPGLYCADRHSARLLADLPVFIRQSHAERDLQALGMLAIESEEQPWQI